MSSARARWRSRTGPTPLARRRGSRAQSSLPKQTLRQPLEGDRRRSRTCAVRADIVSRSTRNVIIGEATAEAAVVDAAALSTSAQGGTAT